MPNITKNHAINYTYFFILDFCKNFSLSIVLFIIIYYYYYYYYYQYYYLINYFFLLKKVF